MNLDAALTAFLNDCEFEELSANTVTWYRKLLSAFVRWYGDEPLTDVTRADVKAFLKHKRGEGRAAATIQGYRRAIRVFFNWCIHEGLATINPTRRVRVPRERGETQRRISLEAVQALLDVCGADIAGVRDRALIMLLWDTGCRAGELLGLRLTDIDWEQDTVYLSGKTGDRTVPLEQNALAAVSDWLRIRPEDHETDAVFVTLRRGFKGALGYSGLRLMLQRRARAADVHEPHNPHAFRHGFGKEYIRRGGDWGTLADTLGHTDPSTTKRFYVKFGGNDLRAPHAQFSPTNGLDV